MHWSERYVGRPYVEGVFDCAELARAVLLEVFGRRIALPAERDYAGKRGIARLRAMAAQIESEKAAFAERTLAPQEGDGVLLVSRGYAQHIGIYCRIAGEAWVLHAADSARQVVCTRMRDLGVRGLAVEGYYRWT